LLWGRTLWAVVFLPVSDSPITSVTAIVLHWAQHLFLFLLLSAVSFRSGGFSVPASCSVCPMSQFSCSFVVEARLQPPAVPAAITYLQGACLFFDLLAVGALLLVRFPRLYLCCCASS
jgi:hypothetical protein